MPRMDAHIPADELAEIRYQQDGEAAQFHRINTRYREYADYVGWREERIPPQYRVWRNAEGEHAAFYSMYVPIGPGMPTERGTYCDCLQSSGRVDGCERCRPTLWQRCRCGDRYLVGTGCYCWSACTGCQTVSYLDETEYRLSDDQWDNPAYCSQECIEASGAHLCHTCASNYTRHDTGNCIRCRPCECGDCSVCRRRANIHSYSYKPEPNFLGNGPLYLGLECEVSVNGANVGRVAAAEYVNSRFGNGDIAYLKSDGSVSNGFEIVTHPMSYDWALAEFPWDTFTHLTDEFGVSEDDSCGIHVHASRAGFSGPRHLYLWQKFIYRNARPIQRVARRTNSRWARFNPESSAYAAAVAKGIVPGDRVNVDAWYVPASVRRLVRNSSYYYNATEIELPYPDRYSAINIQNAHTLEMRVFAGSVRPVQIQAALGLVHGSIEYTRQLDAQSVLKKEGWTWAAFRNWTADRSQYESLNSEIERTNA